MFSLILKVKSSQLAVALLLSQVASDSPVASDVNSSPIELEWRVCWSKNQIRHFRPLMSGLNVATKVSARFVPKLTCYPAHQGLSLSNEWSGSLHLELTRLNNKRIKEHRDFTLHIKAAQRKGYSVVQHTELVAYLETNVRMCFSDLLVVCIAYPSSFLCAWSPSELFVPVTDSPPQDLPWANVHVKRNNF